MSKYARITALVDETRMDLRCLAACHGDKEFEYAAHILTDLLTAITKIENEENSLTKSFIPWAGGNQPMPDLSHVQVQFRDSELNTDDNFYPGELDWIHDNTETDIVAYRTSDVQPNFISWDGGTNPAGDAFVEVIYREDQTIVFGNDAFFFNWSHDPNDSSVDIVKYRIII